MVIRRYLRYGPYSTLELRIFSSPPQIESNFLLRIDQPYLPTLIKSLQPVIIDYLQEKINLQGTKRKLNPRHFKDHEVDVTLVLKEGGAGHAVVKRDRVFVEKKQEPDTVVIRDEDGDEVDMDAIPEGVGEEQVNARPTRGGRKTRTYAEEIYASEDEDEARASEEEKEDEDVEMRDMEREDKKKLTPHVQYEGYWLKGWVLCLTVKKIGLAQGDKGKEKEVAPGLLDEWISGSQMVGQITVED